MAPNSKLDRGKLNDRGDDASLLDPDSDIVFIEDRRSLPPIGGYDEDDGDDDVSQIRASRLQPLLALGTWEWTLSGNSSGTSSSGAVMVPLTSTTPYTPGATTIMKSTNRIPVLSTEVASAVIRIISPRRGGGGSGTSSRRFFNASIVSCCLVLSAVALLQQWSMLREFYSWYGGGSSPNHPIQQERYLLPWLMGSGGPSPFSSDGNRTSNSSTTSSMEDPLMETIQRRQEERDRKRVAEIMVESRNRMKGVNMDILDREGGGIDFNTNHSNGQFDGHNASTDKERSTQQQQKQPEPQHTRFLFDYNQPTVRTKHTLPDPKIAHTRSWNHSLFVIVLSARENADRRAAIRDTYGRGHALYFVVGGPNETRLNTTVQEALLTEQQRCGDLLDSIHPDSYEGLSHKLKYGYRWIVRNTNASWILKIDDDTVARVTTLERHILDLFNPTRSIVIGHIVPNSAVARSGKWAELPSYSKSKYPYWAQGSCGHVVSRSVAEFVGNNLQQLPNYQGEDTNLGIWIDESKLPVTWISSRYFVNHGKCTEMDWIVIGHQISVQRMRKCYQVTGDEWDEARLHDKAHNLLKVESLHQGYGLYRTHK